VDFTFSFSCWPAPTGQPARRCNGACPISAINSGHISDFPFVFSHLFLQGLRVVAALRDGRPRAALPVHCVLPDAMDAEPPQSYHPDSPVSGRRLTGPVII